MLSMNLDFCSISFYHVQEEILSICFKLLHGFPLSSHRVLIVITCFPHEKNSIILTTIQLRTPKVSGEKYEFGERITYHKVTEILHPFYDAFQCFEGRHVDTDLGRGEDTFGLGTGH